MSDTKVGADAQPATREVSQVDIEIYEDGKPVIVWGNTNKENTENLVRLCVAARADGRELRVFHVFRNWIDIDAMIDEAISKVKVTTP
jgi:hypothetical protein